MLDYFFIALKNLQKRKIRSVLTILGIVIGVAAIITLITVTQGLQNSITKQFELLGSDVVIVMGGAPGDPTQQLILSKDDAERIERLPEIEYSIPILFQQKIVEYQNKEERLSVVGWPEKYGDKITGDFGLTLLDGKTFTTEGNKAILGYQIAKDKFEEIQINNRITIDGEKFQVIGILNEVGNPDDDNQIYIPLTTAREIFNEPTKLTSIFVRINEGMDVDQSAAKIKKAIEKRLNEKQFTVSTATQLLDQLGDILLIIQIVLVGIATISIVVGSVGIANSMFTNVLERRKEIGIMKAIGATNKDITQLFLIEAAIIGLIGGILGVAIGYGMSKLIEYIVINAGYKLILIQINPSLIIFSLIFAIVIGCLAGAIPARQASKMNVVDSLRKI